MAKKGYMWVVDKGLQPRTGPVDPKGHSPFPNRKPPTAPGYKSTVNRLRSDKKKK